MSTILYTRETYACPRVFKLTSVVEADNLWSGVLSQEYGSS